MNKNVDDINVAIYIRVSTVYQIDKDSLPMQRSDLIQYCKLILNTENYEIFEDAGYSGKNMDRPAFKDMMNKVRSGQFTHILVWKIDRISRNLLDFASMYTELKKLHVTFVSKNEQFDTSTAMGEAMLKIILVFAELERNMTSERVRATMISRAEDGLWNGHHIPIGYEYDRESRSFVINEKEAEIVRMIYDMYEESKSTSIVSRRLNEKGITTKGGSSWEHASVSRVLKNPFYIGDYLYNQHYENNSSRFRPENEWVVLHNHHPAIVTEEQQTRVIRILEENTDPKISGGRPSAYRTKNIHIFSGIVYCGECGSCLRSNTSRRKGIPMYSNYHCWRGLETAGCTQKYVSDTKVGEFVINLLLNILNAQKNFTRFSVPKALEAQLLTGAIFRPVESIDPEGLQELYDLLLEHSPKEDIFAKGLSIKVSSNKTASIKKLAQQLEKLSKAKDRLLNLYLYSSESMPEEEYLQRQGEIASQMNEISEKISELSISQEQEINNVDLIRHASNFILGQQLRDRNYISYKSLAESVDPAIIQSFIRNTIDRIYIRNAAVTEIIFKSGLSLQFNYKHENTPAE